MEVPPIKVIVRLPYNRPSNAPLDPPQVEWNQEKENMLWEVVAKARATQGGGTDWHGLSNHLEVPLPYLLYRAQARYEEDLKGLQDLRDTLNPPNTSSQPLDDHGRQVSDLASVGRNPVPGTPRPRSAALRLATSGRLSSSSLRTPVSRPLDGVRPLLHRGSSQTLTGTRTKTPASGTTSERRPPSPLSSESESSEDEHSTLAQAAKREEEQIALTKQLEKLEKMMTLENLGLVHRPKPPSRSASLSSEPKSVTSPTRRSQSLAPENRTESSSNSPQGSIPSIPSPTSGSQSSSQVLQPRKHTTSAGWSPAASPLGSPMGFRGQIHARYGQSIKSRQSEKGSTQGSTASSFSDISEADVSASALESALLSNVRGGSRLSAFSRGRF